MVQLLWINLIMDIFASLGLATDLPSPEFLKRKPESRNSPIISITMWKMILGQAIYQLVVVFTVHYAGWEIFNPDTEFETEVLQTLVFNIYVWMQFFNQHNCRRVDNKLDIWYQSVLRNPWFIGVQLLTMAGQIAIVFKGGEAFDTVPLTGAQWGWSLLFGLLTIPLGALIRQVPDRYVLALFRSVARVVLALAWPLRSLWAKIPSCSMPWLRRRQKPETVSSRPTGTFPIQGSKSPSVGSDGFSELRRGQMSPDSAIGGAGSTESKIDLQLMIDAAKTGRSIGTNRLELHPETPKDDPILGTRSDLSLPPSQDPALQMLMPTCEEGEGRSRRRRGRGRAVWVEPRRPEPQRPGQQTRKGLSLEWFLRSKRR